MSKVPGITACHAVISDTCRLKGDDVAFEEAIELLRREYKSLTTKHWPHGTQAKFHFVLSVDYPKDTGQIHLHTGKRPDNPD